MKLSIEQSELVAKLSTTSRVVSTRAATQSLAGVLVTASGGSVSLRATDLEMGLQTDLAGDVEGDGSVLLPGRLFSEVARSLPSGTVEIEPRDSERDVLIKDITLISPQMRMAGSGKITFVPDVPLRLQPLLVNLQIGARDQLADSFRQLRLLGAGGPDGLGYVPLSEPIQLDGTLQSIGTAQLQRLIYNAITN